MQNNDLTALYGSHQVAEALPPVSDGEILGSQTRPSAQPLDAPRSYKSQFGKNPSLILERLRSHSAGQRDRRPSGGAKEESHDDSSTGKVPAPPSSEAHAAAAVSGTLPLPEHPGRSPKDLAALNASPIAQVIGAKRKRKSDVEDVDFTTEITVPCPASFTTVIVSSSSTSTALPRSVDVVPTSLACSRCQGLNQKLGDTLVTCSRCTAVCHQQCSQPPIDDFRAVDGSYQCRECLLHSDGLSKPRRQLGSVAQQEDLERMRRGRLNALPAGVVPAKPELVGFRGGDASSAARSEYFSGMGRTDLLNILSLCDQLKPHLLTDVLVSVSKRHPDLPIFDSPNWSTRLSSSSPLVLANRQHAVGGGGVAAAPRSIVKSQIGRPRHGHTLLHGKAKQQRAPKPSAVKKVLKRTRTIEVPADTLMATDEEDVLPPTWKKAGEGLYALLPPETEDRALLLETNDEEAFSHFMVDKAGHQIIEKVS